MTPRQPYSLDTSAAPTGLELITGNRILIWLWNAYLQRTTPAGRWLIGPTFLFGLWGSTTLEHQIHVACLYALVIWLVAFICLAFVKPRVSLTIHGADRVAAGETLPIEVEITSQGRRAGEDLYVILHQPPAGIEVIPSRGVALPPLGEGRTTRVTLGLRCPRRGLYTLPGVRAASDFPFGLLNAYRVFGPPRTMIVYPQFSPLTGLHITGGRRYHPGGVALASNLGESFEYIGNRPFREGDNVRDIDWMASARLDDLIVREYRQEYFHRVAIILDTQAIGPKGAEDFERAVSLAASVSDYMARQEYLVDLFAAGPDLYHLTAGRSLAYVDEILEILACVRASGREPFANLEPEIAESLAQITTIVCVFLDWNEARRAFVQRIARDGAALKVIVVRDAAPTLAPAADASLGEISVVTRADSERGLTEV